MNTQHAVIVLPTYNEKNTIVPLLMDILSQQAFLSDTQLSVVVVDDNSPDGTGNTVEIFSQSFPRVFLLRGKKEGLGRAYIRGFYKALHELKADIVLMMDADFSHDPKHIPGFIKAVQEGSDIVIGSRYIRGGSIPKEWPMHRRINSRAGNLIARFLAGIRNINDMTSGYRAIKASYLRKISFEKMTIRGYAITIGLLAHTRRHKAKVLELPIKFADRKSGKSKMSFKDISEFLRVAFAIRMSRLKITLIRLSFLLTAVGIGSGLYYLNRAGFFEITTLVATILVIISLLLTVQGIVTLWYMIYAWEDAEELEKNRSPQDFLRPQYSFTAIIPARHEETVIGDTIKAIANIAYPENMKETLVLCRYDDTATIQGAQRAIDHLKKDNIRVIQFYDETKNKPHALNVGLEKATKEMIVVFDAEDEPHPDIYNIANTVFRRDSVDVIQSGVQLMDYRSSWYAMFNVLEYFFWFKSSLHFFAKKGFIPLGGNTVFLRKSWLNRVGGWDEDCLTEDAEIGIRLSSRGAKIRVVYDAKHATQEETPHDIGSFIRQRTRWNQGFLQVLEKGDWIRLRGFKRKLLAFYILSWPVMQSALFLSIPLSIFMAMTIKLPVGITMVIALPLYIMLLQLVIYNIGMIEFTHEYKMKYPFWMPIALVISFLPFQIMLGISTFRAVIRTVFNNFAWEKTMHMNTHRETEEELHIPYISLL